ncbi:MAG: hypothetical protein H6Q58_788 [Firmicutes bacterium]|nr:hypothetical protein [Bacillota bacterium]
MDKENRSDRSPYKSLVVTVAAVLLISFAIIMLNQVLQLINLAMNVSPVFGSALAVFFAVLALGAVITTILIIARLEKPLPIPDESSEAEYALFLGKLKKRLIRNKYLKSQGFVWETGKTDKETINEALDLLDKESQRLIKSNASAVFITTAVSQNGPLDSVFVFITAVKLVWKISMLYNQRPAVSDITKLYANVFATVLLTRQIDDLDLVTEQLEPIISTLFGGTVGSVVPGVSYAVSFVVDSVFEGSINTLLTLRVGIITQKYCRSLTKTEPKALRKAATVQACDMLGSIVSENSKKIADALFRAVKNVTVDSINTSKDKFAGMFDRLWNKQ